MKINSEILKPVHNFHNIHQIHNEIVVESAFSPLLHLHCVCRYICLQEKLLKSASRLSFHKVEMILFVGWEVLIQRMHSKMLEIFILLLKLCQEIYICLQEKVLQADYLSFTKLNGHCSWEDGKYQNKGCIQRLCVLAT